MASAVPYQTFYDEEDIAVNDEELSGSGSDVEEGPATDSHLPGPSHPPRQRSIEARINQYMDNERWPRKIGIVHLFHGVLLFLLGEYFDLVGLMVILFLAGLAQILLIPFIESEEKNPVHLNKHNLYGLGLWSGLLVC